MSTQIINQNNSFNENLPSTASSLSLSDSSESSSTPPASPTKPSDNSHKKTSVQNTQPLMGSAQTIIVTLVCFLVLAPLTIVIGSTFGQNHNYYVESLLMVVYSMVPFFVSFESRKPEAKELVILAVMCALAVAARAAFIWLPGFKPILALIIIGALAFGPQSGFLIGSVSMLVSNFFFGQGPWTPWQMFAFGLAGFITGLLAKKGVFPKDSYSTKQKIGLCVYAGLLTICFVGPLLDTCALFTMITVPGTEGILAVYASGFPVNCVQAVAVVATLFILINPLMDKLARVKQKYGMMEV